MDIELHHLRHLLAVVSHATLKDAADSVFVTQPALSKSIARLEDRVGSRLFDRVGRRLVLNELGRRVVAHARGLVQQAAELDDEVLRWREGQLGAVVVGVGPVVELELLPQVLLRFAQECPDVPIVVRTGSSADLLGRLRDEDLHLFVADYEVDASLDDLEVVRLAAEPLVAAVADNHVLADRSALSIEDLSAFKIIAPSPPTRITGRVRELLPSLPSKPHVQCDSYDVLIRLAEATTHLLLGPERLLRRYAAARAVAIVPFAFELPLLQPSVMFRRKRTPSPAVRRFRELVVEVGRA
ncbi:MAG: LysR family transcriptional regulator [Myxococcota bacterium]